MAKSSDYVVRFTGQDNLSKTTKQIKQELNAVGQSAATASDKIDAKFQKIINSSAPLKRQLRDLQAIMAEMNMKGLSNTDQFTQIAQAAGQIKDAISDAAAATSRFSNDTATLQAGIQAFQGIAAAGSVATGVMALFGSENEEATRAIQKVQGAIAILNGVQAVANTLNKDSALMLKLKEIRMAASTGATAKNTVATTVNNVAETIKTASIRTNTSATAKNTVAEVKNTAATSANTIATQVWNTAKAIAKALLGDFSGLLLVGAGVLGTYAIATSDSTSAQQKQNEALKEGKSLQEKYVDTLSSSSSQITDQKIKLQELNAVLQNTNVAMDLRKKALEEIKQIIPGVNAYIDQEGVVHGNVVTAIYQHIQALDKLQKAMALFELKKQLTQDLMKSELMEGVYQQNYDRFTNNQRYDRAAMARNTNTRTTYKTVQGAYLGEYHTVKITTTELNKQGKIAEQNLKTNQKGAAENRDLLQTQRRQSKELRVQLALTDKLAEKYGITADDFAKAALSGGDISKMLNGKTTPAKSPRVSSTPHKPQIVDTDDDLKKLANERLQVQKMIDQGVGDELEHRKKLVEIAKKELEISSKRKNIMKDSDFADFFNTKQAEIKGLEFDVVKLSADEQLKTLQKQFDEGAITELAEFQKKRLSVIEKVYKDVIANFDTTNEDVKDYVDILVGLRETIVSALDNLEAQADIEKQAEDLLADISNNKEKGPSDFEKAVAPYQAPKGQDEVLQDTLNNIQQQMDKNQELIESLTTIKSLFEAIGFTGSEAYAKITEQLDIATNKQTDLGSQAEEAAKKQQKFRKTIDTYEKIADAAQNTASILSDLGQASDDTTLQTAGIIASAIANIILGYGTASAAAGGTLTPFGWAAFSLAGLAQIASVISQIHSLSGYAEGGIVTGGSTTGDNILARLNAGEMVINARQQSNLFKAIDSGDFGNNNSNNSFYVDWRIKGPDLYGTLKNYSKTVAKTGKNIGIR